MSRLIRGTWVPAEVVAMVVMAGMAVVVATAVAAGALVVALVAGDRTRTPPMTAVPLECFK
jgi:hypothetical protein